MNRRFVIARSPGGMERALDARRNCSQELRLPLYAQNQQATRIRSRR